ncbi:acyl-CoA dehydrogenase family protein [Nocardia sp. alder85J]|uniref:acyl-CoA dehydrogenase family protein n=1 Tax=Nocardia sp. alder85J TaxID=2862949 RepID=UPI001CD27B98|nr:acyl-CoA dehydrogenase family protein [Nocardia sp. alder85J]MCX4096835.1 acyl-CoA/acyl-ACP dehydrogenase [Nocardia sp. alder85J]
MTETTSAPGEATSADSEDIALLGNSARDFLADFVDNTYLNDRESSDEGYEPARWRRLCDLGWTAASLPDRVGGLGGGLAAAAAVAVQIGRAAFASPWLPTVRAATVLDTLGADRRFDAVLSDIAGGTIHALVAPPDPGPRVEVSFGGGHRLTGPAVVVEWLDQSEMVVLLLPRDPGGPDAEDLWVCAVIPADRLRDRYTVLRSVDNEHSARLDLDGLVLDREFLIADALPGADVAYALGRANLLRTAVMVGGGEAVLEFTARYARERVQFGRPIGGFQAVRHLLARMAIAADAARLTYDEALAALSTPDADAVRDTTPAAIASFVAGRSYTEIVLTAAQVHGGVGTTVEHILHHHFRRAKAAQLRSGRRADRLRELTDALVRNPVDRLWVSR